MRPAVTLAAAAALLVLAVVVGRTLAHRAASAPAAAVDRRGSPGPTDSARAVAPLPATVRAYADATDRAVGLRDELCRCDGRACLEAVQDRFVATLGDARLDPLRAAAYDDAMRAVTRCIIERSDLP